MPKRSVTPKPNTEPDRSISPAFFQRFGRFDLINNLLFNRERVYQSLRRLSPIRTTSAKESRLEPHQAIGTEDQVIEPIELKRKEGHPDENTSMLSYLKSTEMALSVSRRPPSKKAPAKTKPKEKLGLTTNRKRSLRIASQTERASKHQKTVPKANSGKRVNGKGASVVDAFVISDDDDDNDEFSPPRQESRADSLTPSHLMLKIDTPGSENELNPSYDYNNNLRDEIVRIKVAHCEELTKVHQELNASEARVKQTKEDIERDAIETQRRRNVASDKHVADLKEKLEAEKRRSSVLSWECDCLRKELEAARSCLRGEAHIMQQRDEYERLYKEEQDTNADLKRGIVEQDERAIQKATEMTRELQQLAKQVEDLQSETARLKAENKALHVSPFSLASTGDIRSASQSPPPSSNTSNTEQRLANIRKTYITVKRRYDNLYSVATNITTSTRSWNYGSFGEFGQYLRQLKFTLDEIGSEQAATASTRAVRID